MAEITFNEIFREVNLWKGRYRVLKGSAGSGKSMNVARDFILKLSDKTYEGANLLCVRKSENSNLTSTYAELYKAIIDIFGLRYDSYWEIKSSPMQMTSLITGNSIVFRGCNDAKQIEKIKSITFPRGQLTWIWIEEANEITQHDFEILDDRLRGIFKNHNLYYQNTLTLNPVSSRCWIKAAFFDAHSDDVLAHHSTFEDNRFIGDDFKKRMERRKELDPEGYRIYGLGEWGETEGVIFNNWRVIDCAKDFDFYDDICYGQDFGCNHANAVLELGIKDNNIYVLREIYETDKTTSDIIAIADSRGFDKSKPMICDSAERDRIIEWDRAGYRAIKVNKSGPDGKSVNAQIDWLKQRKIFIDTACRNTHSEIEQYRWKKDPVTDTYLDEPVKFEDDAMAALRYGVDIWRRRGEVKKKQTEQLTDLQKYRNKRLNHKSPRRYY